MSLCTAITFELARIIDRAKSAGCAITHPPTSSLGRQDVHGTTFTYGNNLHVLDFHVLDLHVLAIEILDLRAAMLDVVSTKSPSHIAAVLQSTQKTWWITDEKNTTIQCSDDCNKQHRHKHANTHTMTWTQTNTKSHKRPKTNQISQCNAWSKLFTQKQHVIHHKSIEPQNKIITTHTQNWQNVCHRNMDTITTNHHITCPPELRTFTDSGASTDMRKEQQTQNLVPF